MKSLLIVPTHTNLAGMIDHTLLKADATRSEIEKLCAEAKELGFATVCVNPYWLSEVVKLLEGSSVKPITVVGFPLGANQSKLKTAEAYHAVQLGAEEIDMVINIGALKDGDFKTVQADIEGVVKSSNPKPVKVIIETALLSEAEKIKACELAKEAGAHFVKTSTGFSKSGATVQDVRLMRETVGKEMGVKASGGIRNKEDALAMLEAGANRLGTSASVLICE